MTYETGDNGKTVGRCVGDLYTSRKLLNLKDGNSKDIRSAQF
jgi:hypothetical protein